MIDLERETFTNPGKEYRPCPFWAWNDRLDPPEIDRQIRWMKQVGMGGFFMHSRPGLVTPYLGEQWMAIVRVSLERAKELDLEAWLYDEDNWSSGYGGGFIVESRPDLQCRVLYISDQEAEDVPSEHLRTFFITDHGYWREDDREAPADARRVEARVCKGTGQGWPSNPGWFNGALWPDLLHPQTTREFIKLTHDAYAREFGKDFGPHMPGMFTDEPNIDPCKLGGGDARAWSTVLPETFQRMHGYSILDHLPALFNDYPDSRKIRHDYWQTVSKLFSENYSKQLSEWCCEHGLMLTGHYQCHDHLFETLKMMGDGMRHYEYQQLPGVDHLQSPLRPILRFKEAQSVSAQFGRQGVLCEIFGVTDRAVRFGSLKRIADFNLALGVTKFVPHLVHYSIRGLRKRDCPPSFDWRQGCSAGFRQFHDYIARCCYAGTAGRPTQRILVLHPTSSAFALHNSSELKDLDEQLETLSDHLVRLHWDFHFGNETILERHGRIDGQRLVVGQMSYDLVIVPPSLTWMPTTAALLREFPGNIVFVGQWPELVAATAAEETWQQILQKDCVTCCENTAEALEQVLSQRLDRDLSIRNEEGKECGDVIYWRRQVAGGELFFLANISEKSEPHLQIAFPGRWQVESWNAWDGRVYSVKSASETGNTIVEDQLEATGSRIYRLTKDRSDSDPPRPRAPLGRNAARTIELSGPWRFERTEPNVLVLDTCRLALAAERFGPQIPVIEADRLIREQARPEAELLIQPWWAYRKGLQRLRDGKVHFHLQFKVLSEIDRPKGVALLIEEGSRYAVKVNGRGVDVGCRDWPWGPEIHHANVGNLLSRGENTIDLEADYVYDLPVEPIYLAGDFAVVRSGPNGPFTLTDEPETLSPGNWVEQGYPFYPGNIICTCEFDVDPTGRADVFVETPAFDAAGCMVEVNNQHTGLLIGPGRSLPITPYVISGRNEIRLTLLGTTANTLWPLHQAEDTGWVNSNYWHTDATRNNFTEQYRLAPFGMTQPPRIVIYQ